MIQPIYRTTFGKTFCGDSLLLMREIPSDSIDLVVTSPPYALHFKKEYGNADQQNYVNWFAPFADEIFRILKPSGSFVLNIGGTWTPGKPTRSLYHFRLLLRLCDEIDFNLCQEFFWYNPAKLPAPAEWVNVRRIRVKDSVEYIYWLGKTAYPKADNTKILNQYSKDMLRLIKKGVAATQRPSGHNIREGFAADKGGAIPGNLIQCGNNESNSNYMSALKQAGKKIHPARFPAELPRFFINFLTDPGDIVLDPFAGSNTTGYVAERLERNWISMEISEDYVRDSLFRFEFAEKESSDSLFPKSQQVLYPSLLKEPKIG